MSNLYKTTLKLGKRSVILKLHSSSIANVETFCKDNLYGEIQKIEKVEFEALETKKYPIDDVSLYKKVCYFHVRNPNFAHMYCLHTIKNTRSYDEVFNSMQSLLKMPDTTSIDSYLTIKESSK